MRTLRTVAVLLPPLLVASCSSSNMGMAELQGGVEMGLRRGAGWTTLKVAPPHIIGPRTNVKFKNGHFTGAIDNRGINVRADQEGLFGSGPHGPVSVSINEEPGAMLIDGTWNGSRVHFKITNDKFEGTISIWSANYTGGDQNCQYVLDKVEEDGARSGSSICLGLPEQTRLEVPGQISTWLTRPELACVILVLLSSPPTTYLERGLP